MTEELNLPCLYKVYRNLEANTYFFSTNTKAEYEILFIDGREIFSFTPLENSEIFNIIINKTKAGTGRRDPEIAKTIEAVLEHFFINKNRILIYTCDSADSRHISRNRLFNKWFINSSLKKALEKLDYHFTLQDPIYYTSMIFHKDHQLGRVTVIQTFKEVTKVLSDSK
ncbi:DUF6169 family protein [Fulvivirga maritima]|uniref:DUF6169 family protein n=1 Tax=Fulvivirga maritima TaxID=2904247 RepID=UPI001F31DF41|nr:DUF6169 family protein [Fulvivirga maritima]UII26540.1 DUF6169 family protein [Fulvivirga maritima]